ncbi:L-aspartate/glutamate-specific racemase [Oligella ureolytica]
MSHQFQHPYCILSDPTASAIKSAGYKQVALLGTRFTMEQDFYKKRLLQKHGINVLIPSPEERELVHHIIYNELCLGILNENSRRLYLNIIENMAKQGAEAIILGCTEISMLIKPAHTNVSLFDTTEIHAVAAAKQALAFQ